MFNLSDGFKITIKRGNLEEKARKAFFKTKLYKNWLAREIRITIKRPGFKKEWENLKKQLPNALPYHERDVSDSKWAERTEIIKKWVEFCNKWRIDIGPNRKIRPILPVSFPIPFIQGDKGTVVFKRAVSLREWKDLWPLVNHYLKVDFGDSIKPGKRCDDELRKNIYQDFTQYRSDGKSSQAACTELAKIYFLSESRVAHIVSEENRSQKHLKTPAS